MTEFLETTKAFKDNHLQLSRLAGEHFSGKLRHGLDDSPVGYTEYQPDYHEPGEIDGFAPLSEALGIDYVRDLDDEFALHVNVVTDELPRTETQGTTQRKLIVAGQIVTLLEKALPEPSDQSRLYAFKRLGMAPSAYRRKANEETAVSGKVAFLREVSDIALDGLTFVISDFRDMPLNPQKLDKNKVPKILDNVVAIKVNHLLERVIPEEIASINLEGSYELHNAKQRNAYNALFDEEHQLIVDDLENAGARVVSVIADPRLKRPYFDVMNTDQQIAAALRDIIN